LYKWKAKYGGERKQNPVTSEGIKTNGFCSEGWRFPRPSDLKSLKGENSRLKRLLADAMLADAGLKDLLGKNGDARCTPRDRRVFAPAYEMSERRVCRIIGCDRASVHYQAERSRRCSPLRTAQGLGA
jgi:hypothetical protein